jgi:hypothetical protein
MVGDHMVLSTEAETKNQYPVLSGSLLLDLRPRDLAPAQHSLVPFRVLRS